MNEKIMQLTGLSKSEIKLLLVAALSIWIGTSLTMGSHGLFAGLFYAVAPILYFSLPGYFLVKYANRKSKSFRRPWAGSALAILGLIFIALGVLGAVLYVMRPWMLWLLVGVAAYYFFGRRNSKEVSPS